MGDGPCAAATRGARRRHRPGGARTCRWIADPYVLGNRAVTGAGRGLRKRTAIFDHSNDRHAGPRYAHPDRVLNHIAAASGRRVETGTLVRVRARTSDPRVRSRPCIRTTRARVRSTRAGVGDAAPAVGFLVAGIRTSAASVGAHARVHARAPSAVVRYAAVAVGHLATAARRHTHDGQNPDPTKPHTPTPSVLPMIPPPGIDPKRDAARDDLPPSSSMADALRRSVPNEHRHRRNGGGSRFVPRPEARVSSPRTRQRLLFISSP